MWLYVNSTYGLKHLINIDHVADIKYDQGLDQTVIMSRTLNGSIRISGNHIQNIKEYIIQRAENENRHAVCKIGEFDE